MRKIVFFLSFLSVLVLNAVHVFAQAGPIYAVAGCEGGGCVSGAVTVNGVPATSVPLFIVGGVAVDDGGDVYVVQNEMCAIRKIDATTGLMYTIAGNGTLGYSGDGGPATNAELANPTNVAIDHLGNVFIADAGFTFPGRVRKVSTSGIITTVAGGGTSTSDGIPATAHNLTPVGIYVDAGGNIYAGGNNQLYKVNGATGIITTIAGNGTASDAGDGGPATGASLSSTANTIGMDGAGNIYFVSASANRVRKINTTTGIISTVAGGGSSTSYGVPATDESLTGITSCLVDGAGNLFITDGSGSQRVNAVNNIINNIGGCGGQQCLDAARNNIYCSNANMVERFSYYPIIGYGPFFTADSFSVAINKLCNGPEFSVVTPDYIAGRSIKTYFGDGTTDSSTIMPYLYSGGYAKVDHSYMSAGSYTINQVLYSGSSILDSLSYSYSYEFCRSLPIMFFYDEHGDCVKDSTDPFAFLPSVTEVDSNGIAVDTLSATSGFVYNAYSVPGDIYSFRPLSGSDGLVASCPAGGYILDTISSSTTPYPDKYFGLTCSSTTSFDLSVNAVIPVTGEHDQWGHIFVQNNTCLPADATVTLHFSPKYVYTGGAMPAPASSSANTITWYLPGLTASDGSAPFDLYYAIWDNPATGYLVAGDTVEEYITVTPIAGDANPANNTEIVIDTVRASCDPNEMSVSPAGCIPADTGASPLQYTIHFQNTGTDTASHIYVMDTLSGNLDPKSLRIVLASATMNIDLQKGSGYNIVKFDFPNINLLDSSQCSQCSGSVIFNINTQAGLPDGYAIYNHAGIFFDYNPVVLTNTVENTIGCASSLNVVPILPKQKVEVFPNPTTEELTIKMDQQAYSSYSITNNLGQVLMQQELHSTQTTVNVQRLPPGMYYITFKSEQGSTVQKFVKM